jgi:type IV pilus assembly protein PilA
MTDLKFGALAAALIWMFQGAPATAQNATQKKLEADEASAISSLRAINTAALTYAGMYSNGFPPSLKTLGGRLPETCEHAGFLEPLIASGRKDGYKFSYTPRRTDKTDWPKVVKGACKIIGAREYHIHADPIKRGTTGQRSFYTDQTTVIRYETDKPATADSPPLP